MRTSYVITGFLGSGKTTLLLNTVKTNFSDQKVAIIVNEFGEIGIDGEILRNAYSEVLEISEGCICCQLAQEFEAGVSEIVQKYDPQIIFVETSGASEPFPIYYSLTTLGIGVEGVLCVVDAKHYHNYIDEEIFKYQVGGSNIIVLNKLDLVDDQALLEAKNELTKIKERYNLKNTFTGEAIFKNYVFAEATQGVVDAALFEHPDIEAVASLDSIERRTPSVETLAQKTIYLTDIDFDTLDSFVSSLPSNVYRVKGIVKPTDISDTLIVNASFGDVSYEPYDKTLNASFLVLIGKDIQQEIESLKKLYTFITTPRFVPKFDDA